MSDVGRASVRGATGPLLAVALLSVVLLGCGRVEQVEAGGLPPRVPAPTAPSVETSSFQGAVAAFDRSAGHMVVAVQIVWTPVLKAGAHERHVLVDPHTRWEPSSGLADVMIGDEVQVEAVDAADGAWRAVRIQLLDID